MASWLAHLFLLLLCLVLLAGAATPQPAPPLSVDSADRWVRRPGCQSKCGNVSIPYPFGIDPGCFRKDFEINCINGTAYLGRGPGHDIEVVDILQGTPYLQSTLVVNHYIARDCYNQDGSRSEQNVTWINIIGLPNYKISHNWNRFVAIGCDTVGYIWSHRESTFWTGCLSLCTNASIVPNDTCSGIGCCAAPIPMDLRNFSLFVTSVDKSNSHSFYSFAHCSYAFLADESKLNFNLSSFTEYETRKTAPVTLDWAIMGQTCEEANGTHDFACLPQQLLLELYKWSGLPL